MEMEMASVISLELEEPNNKSLIVQEKVSRIDKTLSEESKLRVAKKQSLKQKPYLDLEDVTDLENQTLPTS